MTLTCLKHVRKCLFPVSFLIYISVKIVDAESAASSCILSVVAWFSSTVIQNVANFSLVRLFGFRYFTYLLLPDWNLSSIS
ncbi:unnamed protein product [Schistosoma intercalatum]|nr:unnamed protein product [Schistosoma intercalatum]